MLDGGFSSDIYESCPVTEERAFQEERDGGMFTVLPPERAKRAACLLETCETYRRERLEAAAIPIGVWGVVGALVLGVLGGLALSWFLGR